ncbi:hypothetical protein CVT24_005830 [Panaeolus cyanescens]|uniref:Uncharacterized protein n=1 Tax=Panaeolus cyanescens TaxID=181874 RepID=A0A409V915_9AGAR|nr:hypothetical protein CVT24_005830 [Panaeolus cyanescens]
MYSRPTAAIRSIRPLLNAAIRKFGRAAIVPRQVRNAQLALSSSQVPRRREITSPATEEIYLERHHLSNIPYSQGLCTDPENLHPEDTMVQAVHAGMQAHRDYANLAIDAASPYPMDHVDSGGIGNPERIGMIEQVGSANGTARFFAFGGIQGKPLMF